MSDFCLHAIKPEVDEQGMDRVLMDRKVEASDDDGKQSRGFRTTIPRFTV